MIINIIIFIIVFSLLVLTHELGHFISAKLSGMKVEEFGVGFPPKIFSFKKGETKYSINSIPLGGFVKILGEDGDDSENKDSRNFNSKPIWQRVIVLSAGVFMNFLVGFILLTLVFSVGAPQKLVVVGVADNSPAMSAGIADGDIIKGFNSNMDEFISYINEHSGEELEIVIERNGEEKQFSLIPREDPPEGEGALGVALSEGGYEKQPFYMALWMGLKESISIFLLIFIMLFKLVSSIFTGGDLLSSAAGPVGIYKATIQAANMGWVYLSSFVALISLNLAALNIFPFPALDGGRIIFLIIEKIKGSPVSEKIQGWVNSLGFLLLIILLVFVTINYIFYR